MDSARDRLELRGRSEFSWIYLVRMIVIVYTRTEIWPNADSGPIADVPEKWSTIDYALRSGLRGLPAGSSLARLLAEHRGVRNKQALPKFTTEQIIEWAEAHYRRTAEWPHVKSGPIESAPGETWSGVSAALRVAGRKLTSVSSLACLLDQHRKPLRLPRGSRPRRHE